MIQWRGALALATGLLAWACTERNGPQPAALGDASSDPNLEAVKRFNESSYNLGLAVRWSDNGNGVREPGEFSGLKYVSSKAQFENGRPTPFLQKLFEKVDWLTQNRGPFATRLRDIPRLDDELKSAAASYQSSPSEENRRAYRRALRNRDLARRLVVEIEIDFTTLPLADQRAIKTFLDKAAPHVEGIYLAQIEPKNLLYREEIIERGEPEDLFAFHNLGGVQCLTEGVDPLCSAHPDSPRPTPNQGFWPEDHNQETHDRLLKADAKTVPDIEGLKSSFVYRIRKDGKLEWRSLNAYPATGLHRQGLVEGLREVLAVQGMNESIAKFLRTRNRELTDATKPFPFFDGDIDWINIQGAWDLTLGYYEEENSPFHMTAIMESFLGVVDAERERQGQQFRELLTYMEERIAKDLGSDYRRRDFSALPPLRFENAVDIGDSRARYVPAAFYLPNIPPHGRDDLSKKVILLNNMAARMDQISLPMAELTMGRGQLARLKENRRDIRLFVVGHENAHGSGPGHSYLVREEGGRKVTANQALGGHGQSSEEARADMVGLASLPEAVQRGIITKEQAENAALGLVASLNRGLSYGEEDSHGSGAFVEFTSLFELGGIIENSEGRYEANLADGRIFQAADQVGAKLNRIRKTGDHAGYDRWYRYSVANLPKTMKEKYLPVLRDMPKDNFPYYRFKFSPGV